MAYGRNYRGGYQRSRTFTPGRVARVNARPGECRICGELVPAGAGQLWREESGAWSVVHTESARGGWLMNPQPLTGGCPQDTDADNAESHARGFFGPDAPMPASERERIARIAARYAAANPVEAPRAPRKSYAYTSTGARMTDRASRCIDAPCCGCCD